MVAMVGSSLNLLRQMKIVIIIHLFVLTEAKDIAKFKDMANSVCAAELEYQKMQVVYDSVDSFDHVNALNTVNLSNLFRLV